MPIFTVSTGAGEILILVVSFLIGNTIPIVSRIISIGHYVMRWVAGDLEYMRDIPTETIITSVTPNFMRPIAVLIVGK